MVGGGGVCEDSDVRVRGSTEALPPLPGSAPMASAASAIGAIASSTDGTGSAAAGPYLPATEPPAI